jgi:endonuclease I
MKGDMHHLFTCESDCNSFRSNYAYWQFTEEVFREKCGRLDAKNNRFEPVHGKGAVARATLYFALRYPRKMGDAPKEMQSDRLDILLGWHAEFPPTDWETHRNAAIFAVQGNRNPLIDHPEWAAKIDFKQGIGA